MTGYPLEPIFNAAPQTIGYSLTSISEEEAWHVWAQRMKIHCTAAVTNRLSRTWVVVETRRIREDTLHKAYQSCLLYFGIKNAPSLSRGGLYFFSACAFS